MAYLVIVRHGKTWFNENKIFTGRNDIAISSGGKAEAKRTAKSLKDIKFDMAYTSLLKRAKETLQIIMNDLKIKAPVKEDFALNERDYGDYTGKNKWQVKEQVGEEEFTRIRRSWDHHIPNGESLKMVYQRVMPYYEKEILPNLKKGKNVIISTHDHVIRALIKYLENVSDNAIESVGIETGEALVYQIDKSGKVVSKEIRAQNEKVV